MSLKGTTLFAGDSITVGLAPHVKVDGEKLTLAQVGQGSAALLRMLEQNPSVVNRADNMVVLIGTNDIGTNTPVEKLFETLQRIWHIGTSRGMRVIAMTIPPVKGYAGFPNFETVNERRKALNARINDAFVAGRVDRVIDLSFLLADRSDPERLAAAYDGGDHLHPRKDMLGGLLTIALAGGPEVAPPPPSEFPWTTTFLLVGMVVGGTILLARKDSFGGSVASRILHRFR